MRWQGLFKFGIGVGIGLVSAGGLAAQAPTLGPPTAPVLAAPTTASAPGATPAPVLQKADPIGDKKPDAPMAEPAKTLAAPYTFFDRTGCTSCFTCGRCADDGCSPLGPTPFSSVGILQDWIFGKDNKDACIKIGGWMDFDYTYRSTGTGITGVAPVMNRFGNEFTVRELGLMLTKELDKNCWSWGFNIIAIAGADASFLAPSKGWYAQTDPRFGFSLTDLNLTAHLPILTEGGVDVKAGRQTTAMGWAGAVAWARPFTSGDYAWYNLEEGRYTGVSATWHVSKQLDWYNGIEFGWQTFFAQLGSSPNYITKISYWLDEDAKDTQVWLGTLTGPTSDASNKNTTMVEIGGQKNWNRYLWTVLDFQAVYSLGAVGGATPPPGYIQRAYDVLTYNGVHLNKCWDFNTRFEYYYDADGRGYAGGLGIPKTSYFEGTLGLNYHPTKWMEFRPEIRYDGATNRAFGGDVNNLHRQQLCIAADLLIKF